MNYSEARGNDFLLPDGLEGRRSHMSSWFTSSQLTALRTDPFVMPRETTRRKAACTSQQTPMTDLRAQRPTWQMHRRPRCRTGLYHQVTNGRQPTHLPLSTEMGEFLQHLGNQRVVQRTYMKTPLDTATEKMPPQVEAFKTGGTDGINVKTTLTAVDRVCKRQCSLQLEIPPHQPTLRGTRHYIFGNKSVHLSS